MIEELLPSLIALSLRVVETEFNFAG